MRKCVFCGTESRLTKEHVWSAGLLDRRQGKKKYSSRRVPDKFIGPNSLQIKDVCVVCNNERLSKLDNYICNLYDEYFSSTVHPNDQIVFKYEYSLLSRWLLKTLYNNARYGKAEKSHIKVLKKYVNNILNSEFTTPEVQIFLQLIIPYKDNNGEVLKPIYMTAGPISVPGFHFKKVCSYTVCIDSFRFIIVIRKNESEKSSGEIANVIPKLPATYNAIELTKFTKQKIIEASDIDARYALLPAIIQDYGKWRRFLQHSKKAKQ